MHKKARSVGGGCGLAAGTFFLMVALRRLEQARVLASLELLLDILKFFSSSKYDPFFGAYGFRALFRRL